MERASEASSAEQVTESAVRANERTDERMAQYSTRRFHTISTHSAVATVALLQYVNSNLDERLTGVCSLASVSARADFAEIVAPNLVTVPFSYLCYGFGIKTLSR